MYSFLNRLFTVLPRTKLVVGLCLIGFGGLADYLYGNAVATEGGCIVGALVAVLLFLSLVLWESSGKTPPPSEVLLLPTLLVLFGLSIFLFSFFFYNNAKEEHRGKIWIVNNEVFEEEKLLFAIPFFQNIRSVSVDQDVRLDVTATTKDGVRVRGRVHADLELVFDKSAILRLVEANAYPDKQIKGNIADVLEIQFRHAVAYHDLADLQDKLVLEWETGRDISDTTLRALDVKWTGGVEVTDLHPYFAPDSEKVVF